MENRRDSHGFADLGKARAAKDGSRFGSQETGLTAGYGITSCCQHYDVMFDQFLDDGYMPRIQRGSGVVSPNHAADTPYAAVDDVIV